MVEQINITITPIKFRLISASKQAYITLTSERENIMNTFANAINNQMTYTTNGMPTRLTTGNACTTLFFKIGASRNQNIIPEFVAAYAENKDIALRILQWSRDIREGSGERETFRTILKHLELVDVEMAKKVMDKIPLLGRFDDLLIDHDNQDCQDYAFNIYKKALEDNNGLAFKWCPRENSAKKEIANKFRNYLGLTPREYRKYLVNGTKVTENQMCNNDWDNINFSHVPSVCHARNKKAFGRHTEKYAEYIKALVKGDPTVKINASAIFPHDVLKTVISQVCNRWVFARTADLTQTELDAIEQQWKALPNFVGDRNILPMVDVSGSMEVEVSPNLSAIEIALSLGLYLADKNSGKFKDIFLTFSRVTELVTLKGNIIQKVMQMNSSTWSMTTDIESAFEKILQVAIDGKVPNEEMPSSLLILSDQQFNGCVKNYKESSLDMVRGMYARAGYTLPNIIYWNLNSYNNVPVAFDELGTALISGYSPNIMKTLFSVENMTPIGIMMNTVNIDRYSLA